MNKSHNAQNDLSTPLKKQKNKRVYGAGLPLSSDCMTTLGADTNTDTYTHNTKCQQTNSIIHTY